MKKNQKICILEDLYHIFTKTLKLIRILTDEMHTCLSIDCTNSDIRTISLVTKNGEKTVRLVTVSNFTDSNCVVVFKRQYIADDLLLNGGRDFDNIKNILYLRRKQ